MHNSKSLNRSEVFAMLGFEYPDATDVIVRFSGGEDEGGVDSITVHKGDKEIAQIEEGYGNSDSPLGEALSEPVYDRYSSFAGEFHVTGQVRRDLKSKTVKMDGQEAIEQWQDIGETL